MTTRTPSRGPAAMTPPISWPSTSGATTLSKPMPPSSYQCRSEPQRPTAVTRTRSSPGPGTGSGSWWTRTSLAPCSRSTSMQLKIAGSRRRWVVPPCTCLGGRLAYPRHVADGACRARPRVTSGWESISRDDQRARVRSPTGWRASRSGRACARPRLGDRPRVGGRGRSCRRLGDPQHARVAALAGAGTRARSTRTSSMSRPTCRRARPWTWAAAADRTPSGWRSAAGS